MSFRPSHLMLICACGCDVMSLKGCLNCRHCHFVVTTNEVAGVVW